MTDVKERIVYGWSDGQKDGNTERLNNWRVKQNLHIKTFSD